MGCMNLDVEKIPRLYQVFHILGSAVTLERV